MGFFKKIVPKVLHHATPLNGFGAFGGRGLFGFDGSGLGGGGGGDLYSRQMIDNRRNEINSFAQQLGQARQNYLGQLGNYQNATFSRFAPQAEAMFAGRGLQVTGGAFQSALAKASAELSGQYMTEAYGNEREDLNTVEGLRQNLFSSHFDADTAERGAKYKSKQSMMQGIGGFAGRLGLMGAGAMMGGPMGAMAGQQVGGQLFGEPQYEPSYGLNLGYKPRRSVIGNPFGGQ